MPDNRAVRIAGVPEPEHTSESEEMYLITVARAGEEGTTGPVPVAKLAGDLGVSTASANEMIRKLAARGMLTYEPYRGVELTTSGRRIADRVLRTRRLWATFLAEHLGFTPYVADEQACELEHVTTADAAERLAEFLGDPEIGPLGHRIPGGDAVAADRTAASLTDLGIGDVAEVVSVGGAEQSRRFLAAEGIAPGSRVSVAGAGRSGLLVTLDAGVVHVSGELAAVIEVRREKV